MEYSKQLISKATNHICDICKEPITEAEAHKCEFQYSHTSSKRDIFVHIRCWIKLWGG